MSHHESEYLVRHEFAAGGEVRRESLLWSWLRELVAASGHEQRLQAMPRESVLARGRFRHT